MTAPQMDRVRLGRTDLDVSVVALGAGGSSRLGQGYGASTAESVRLVRAAVDDGINLIDTAANYHTEGIVGEAVAGRRDSVVISTKSQATRPGTDMAGLDLITAADLRASVEASLARLRTDYIDIFHLHGVHPGKQYDRCAAELVPELQRLQGEGKIRFLGVTEAFNTDAGHAMLAKALADDLFDVVMVGFNLVNQSAVSRVLPVTRAQDVGTLGMYAVRGRLATAAGARELVDEAVACGEVDPADIDGEDPLGFVLADPSVRSLVDACYRFNRHAPGADVILTSTGRIEHLRDNVASLNSPPLPQPVLDRLHAIFGRVESVSA